MSYNSTAAMRPAKFEAETALVRQGTFETDPKKTLRSKSGKNIKRGSIAIPVIDENNSRKASNGDHSSLIKQEKKGKESVLKSVNVNHNKDKVPVSSSESNTKNSSKSKPQDNSKTTHAKSEVPVPPTEKSQEKKIVKTGPQSDKTSKSKVDIDHKEVAKGGNTSDKEHVNDKVSSNGTDINGSAFKPKPGVKRTHSNTLLPKNTSESAKITNDSSAKVKEHESVNKKNNHLSNRKHSISNGTEKIDTKNDHSNEGLKTSTNKNQEIKEKISDKKDKMTTPGSKDDLTKYQPSSNKAPYSTVHPYNGDMSFTSGNGKMEESYEAVYMERDTLLTAEAAYKKRIKQLEDELAQFLRNIEELREENIKLRTKIDELEGDAGQSKKTVVINTELDELKREIAKLKAENSEYKGKMKDYIAKQAHLTARNEELSDENEELKVRLASFTIVDDDDTEVVQTPHSEQVDNEESSKLEEELTSVKSQLEQTKSKENELQSEVKKLKELEEKKKKEAEELEDEKMRLKNELDQAKQKASDEAKEKQEAQATELRELKSQVVNLQTENQQAKEEALKLKAENLEQVKKIHSLEKTIKSHEKSITDIETGKLKEMEDLKKANNQLQEDIKVIKQNSFGSDDKIQKLEKENKTLSQQLAQKRSEVDELMSAFKGDHLEDEVNALKEEVTRLKGDLQNKEQDLENVQESLAEITTLRSENEELKNTLEKLNKKLEDNESSNKKLVDENKTLEESKKLLEINVKELESEKGELQQNIHDGEASKKKLRELAETILDKDQAIEDLQLRCNLLEKDLTQKKKEFSQDIEDVKSDLLQEKERLQRELDMERGRKKEAVAKLQRKCDELEEEKISKTNILKKEMFDLKQRLSEVSDVKRAEKEVKELSKELRSVYKKYSEITEQLEQKNMLEQNLFEMTLKMEKLKTEARLYEKEQKEVLALKDQLYDIETSNKRLTEENAQLKKLLDGRNVPKRIDFLEMKQHDADARVRQLEGWVEGLYDGEDGRYSVHKRKYGSNKQTGASRSRYSRNRFSQNSADAIDFMQPRENIRRRSYDDLMVIEDEFTHRSTPTLPSIHSVPARTSVGYSQIHKRRIENAPKRRF